MNPSSFLGNHTILFSFLFVFQESKRYGRDESETDGS
jgi:hypothetical protein